MRTICAMEPGGPDVLAIVERPVPKLEPGEVLVRVRAAGVNRGDIVQREGNYPPPPGASDILGLEVAGEIAAVGKGSTRKIGERVCGLVAGGGYAEYCVVSEGLLFPIPAGLNFVEAAALVETTMTVWTNLFDACQLQPGETVLIHGGASGIGTAAIMMCKAFGAQVIVTVGDDARGKRCEELGANRAINYKQSDFVVEVLEETEGRGADVILDMVGGDYVQRNMEAAALKGRICSISFQKGSKVELNLRSMMLKRLILTGSTLRGRSIAEKALVAQSVRENVWPLIDNGIVRPIVEATFPLEHCGDAHRRLEAGRHFGKVVLTVD
ncbi:MAG: NAD(P)H-quinone oxidoreductase [Novosphingobium sp.]